MDDFWDADIAATNISDVEKNGLQVYRNYNKRFGQHRFQEVEAEVKAYSFDLEGLEADLKYIESADLKDSMLAASSLADELLLSMYLRDKRPALEAKALVSPLGPLGDFNKRLKIAAFSRLIDDDTFIFFDRLRKLRNEIAHSKQPKAPSKARIALLVEHLSEVFDTVVQGREGVPADWRSLEVAVLLKAGCSMHIGKMAWQTLYAPACQRLGVPIWHVWDNGGTELFGRISSVGVLASMRILRSGA